MAIDLQTGRVSYGQNAGRSPTDLAPILDRRTQIIVDEVDAARAARGLPLSAPPGFRPHYPGTPGSHAEVIAANGLYNARSRVRLGDVALYVTRTQDIGQPFVEPMVRCIDCRRITAGMRAVSD